MENKARNIADIIEIGFALLCIATIIFLFSQFPDWLKDKAS